MVNKYVFNCLLKDSIVEVILMLVGRLFQATGPATLKARSPKFVFSIRLGMFSNPCRVDADLNTPRFSLTTAGVHSSVRYSGAMPWSVLKTVMQSLYCIRSVHRSQWGWSPSGQLQGTIADISSWMTSNLLSLNPSKKNVCPLVFVKKYPKSPTLRSPFPQILLWPLQTLPVISVSFFI